MEDKQIRQVCYKFLQSLKMLTPKEEEYAVELFIEQIHEGKIRRPE